MSISSRVAFSVKVRLLVPVMHRTLLTEVENHRTNLMVVLAGYKASMSFGNVANLKKPPSKAFFTLAR